MKEITNKLILVSGLSGVGKSYLSKILEKKGYTITSASSILRKECSNELGDNVSRNILRKYGKEMLANYGEKYFADLLIKNLDLEKKNVLEGIRPFKSIEHISKRYDGIIIYIESEPTIRFQRLVKRDNMNIAEFNNMENDLHEKQIEKVKEIADIILYNNSSIKDFETQILSLKL